MKIEEMQKQVTDMINKIDIKFQGKHDVDTTLIHLIEEFGEIARERYNEKTGRDKLNKNNLKEEIADCVILLFKLADNYNINVQMALLNKINKLKERYNLK